MAGRPVYLLILLMPSPRFELRTLTGYSSYSAIRVEARSCNHYCCWKEKKYYIFWVCVCSRSYPACSAHALYCHVFPVWLYHLFHISKRAQFVGLVTEHKMCVFIFSTILAATFLLIRTDEILSEMYVGLHVKYPLFLSDFYETWIISTDFRKILKYKILLQSVQWGPSCSMWTEGRTWRSQ
jgi:hypothetical protein